MSRARRCGPRQFTRRQGRDGREKRKVSDDVGRRLCSARPRPFETGFEETSCPRLPRRLEPVRRHPSLPEHRSRVVHQDVHLRLRSVEPFSERPHGVEAGEVQCSALHLVVARVRDDVSSRRGRALSRPARQHHGRSRSGELSRHLLRVQGVDHGGCLRAVSLSLLTRGGLISKMAPEKRRWGAAWKRRARRPRTTRRHLSYPAVRPGHDAELAGHASRGVGHRRRSVRRDESPTGKSAPERARTLELWKLVKTLRCPLVTLSGFSRGPAVCVFYLIHLVKAPI